MSKGWFIVNAQSGKEDFVLEVISQKKKDGELDFLEEAVVTTHKEVVFKGGKKKIIDKKSFPGYIYVNMEMNMENRKEVLSLPYVICFIQEEGKILPEPLQESDYASVISRESGNEVNESLVYIDFSIGEKVVIIDGALDGFAGRVADIHNDKKKLMVEVEIFGRVTPVEIDYFKVKKA